MNEFEHLFETSAEFNIEPLEGLSFKGEGDLVDIDEIIANSKKRFKSHVLDSLKTNTAIQTVMNKVQTKYMPNEEINDYQRDDFNKLVGEGLAEVIKGATEEIVIPTKVKVIVASDAPEHKNWLNDIENA